MNNIVATIYRQKISDIQSRIPVRLVQNNFLDNSSSILSEKTKNTLEVNPKKNITDNVSKTGNANSFNSIIKKASQKYKVDDALVRAVVQAESGFNPKAISPAGAMGLMQLMPGTSSGLGVQNAFDPEQNIDGGVRYLKQMMDMYNGDEKMALAAYNCGTGTLKRLKINNLDDPAQISKLPTETKNYIKKITTNINKLNND